MLHRIIRLRNNPFFLSITSGIFLSVPFFSGRFWIFAWLGFVPLFFALENKSGPQRFFWAWVTGIVFWAATIYWLVYVTWPGTVLLVIYLAVYFGLFGYLFKPDRAVSFLLFNSFLWVVLEYLRSFLFTGFPWALLAYSQYLNLAVIQIADITGAWGVSFLIMLVNSAFYLALRQSRCSSRKVVIGTLLLTLAVLAYGQFKIFQYQNSVGLTEGPNNKNRDKRSVKVAVIQGNISQQLKWNSSYEDLILQKYISLTYEASRFKPQLVIWPEAAFPVVIDGQGSLEKILSSAIKRMAIPILIGAVRRKEDKFYNSAILYSQDGAIQQIYDKIHLVPFGEYIPLRNLLFFLRVIVPIGDISPGKELVLFNLRPHSPEVTSKNKLGNLSRMEGARFSILICFEDLFADLAEGFVKNGAGFLVNITNDAWYKRSPAPWQHLQASVFRAVENRRPLVRAANTGISAFISASGSILSLVTSGSGEVIFVDGLKVQELFLDKKFTFYTLHKDFFILVACLGLVYLRFTKRAAIFQV